jgi:diadenosine tetraphosphate (Ap4A) HIT family hydrolase
VWDVPEAGEYFEVARKVAQAEKKAFGIDIVRSQVFGNEIPHAHIWVWANTEEGKENIKENAKKIIEAM